ncbi:MAG: DNA polymerase I [Chitinivibrionia bacterium]|nr:DNA polymerase I [Chitinivibrionia bacterium]
MKNIVIIDSHALIYRSHYAMISNPLTTKKNQITSAIFGFFSYIFKLESMFADASIVVVMDPKTKSFRSRIYSEYKANRKPMPDELRSQIPIIIEIVTALGFPLFSVEDFEADDVINTIAKFADENKIIAKIVSADKDLMQLVNDNIHLLSPTSSSKFTEIAREQVIEKFGVSPDKIHDLLALMGDDSDNIPGISGIGPKGAQKIITCAGSVKNLLQNPLCASNEKYAEMIKNNIDTLELSYKLTELAEVPLDLRENSFDRKQIDFVKVKEIFKELEFEQFLRNMKFPAAINTDAEAEKKVCATIIDTDEKLDNLINTLEKSQFISIDTETSALEIHSAKIVGISFAVNINEAFYIPLGHVCLMAENYSLEKTIAKIKPILENENIKKIGQNLKYDYQILKNYGITMRGISFDTMLAAYILDSKQRFNLEALAQNYLGLSSIPISDIIGKGRKQISFAQSDISDILQYVAEDVILPIKLKEVLQNQFDDEAKTLFENMEMPILLVLADMEYEGILIDKKLFSDLAIKYNADLEKLIEEIYLLAEENFNINSPKQLADILFEKLKIPTGRKTQTGFSTDAEVLEKIKNYHPIVPKLLEYREKQKLLSTYILSLPAKISPKTNRLHTSFNQTGTSTGRLSSSDPNLQNIPVRTEEGRIIRSGFIADKGKILLSADYSQIELRLLAHFSNDQTLISAFKNGIDIHNQTAAKCFGVSADSVSEDMRRMAKTINFGLMYGMGAHSLAENLGIPYFQARKFIENYFAQFPTIKNCIENFKETTRKNGFTKTLFGRKMPLPTIHSENRVQRENAERIAINAPVQGSAADIVKIAMLNIHNRIKAEKSPMKMLLQVHDEIVAEVPISDVEAAKKILLEEMTNAAKLSVPLEVEIGVAENWSMAH